MRSPSKDAQNSCFWWRTNLAKVVVRQGHRERITGWCGPVLGGHAPGRRAVSIPHAMAWSPAPDNQPYNGLIDT